MPGYSGDDEKKENLGGFIDYRNADISNKLTFISLLLLILVCLVAYKCFYIYR